MLDVRDLIAATARSDAFDPNVALATASVEAPSYLGSGNYLDARGDPSNTDARAVDGYCSHGPFQDNICGGRGATRLANGQTLTDLYDPVKSTRAFEAEYRQKAATMPGATVGAIAAAAQRPYDPAGYAVKVNAIYGDLSRTSPSVTTLPATTTTDGDKTCRPGSRLINGVCYTGGGFGPPEDFIKGVPPSDPGTKPIEKLIPDVGGAITGAVDSLRTGTVQFATAAAVIGMAAVLGYYGVKKVL